MNNLFSLVKIFMTTILFISTAFAQNPHDCESGGFGLTGNAFVIQNVSNRDLNILVSGDNNTWTKYTLSAGRAEQFEYPRFKYAKIFTKTSTGEKVSQYHMTCARRYTLKFNNNEKKWDFFLISEE